MGNELISSLLWRVRAYALRKSCNWTNKAADLPNNDVVVRLSSRLVAEITLLPLASRDPIPIGPNSNFGELTYFIKAHLKV